MTRVRILGSRDRLAAVLESLQDLGLVHLTQPAPGAGLEPLALSPRQERLRRHLGRLLDDVERAVAELRPQGKPAVVPGGPEPLVRWARLARRLRSRADGLRQRSAALTEERALLLKYRGFFTVVQQLLGGGPVWQSTTALSVLLRPGEAEGTLAELSRALAAIVGDGFEMRSQPVPGGGTAVLLLIPASAAERVERALAEARVSEIAVPEGYGASLAEAVPRMMARLAEIPGELAALDAERARLAREHGPELLAARQAVHDRLRELEALPLSRSTAHAFVLEGWLPADALPRLERRLADAHGGTVVASAVARECWSGEEAPVVLRNPRLLRPFEALVRMLPLPRYGTIDPTPFVAVFFPMLYGVMLGDVGYGALLAALALALRRRSRPGSLRRSVAEIAGACAVFAITFGVLYGELLGDLGRRFGLRPLLFDREEAVLPFLGLAVSLGLVHVLLGLVLGVVGSVRGHPREAAGRGVAALMVLLLLVALLAAVEVLPRAFFTPAVVALLVALPVLVVLEGIIAPVELLATVGNVLSYARVMALGTASVMLAVVANRMIGAMGSAVVGVLFAVLFHLVNFALGLFSPAIHALRLHYVEFFGKFYSPGGVAYRPFGHWSPGEPRES